MSRSQRARAPIGEQPLQIPALEDQEENTEYGAQAESVHQDCFQSSITSEAGHKEKDDQC